MKKKFNDLTTDDFPGIDPVKFEEWKKAKETADKNTIVFLILFVVFNVILVLAIGYLWLGGLLLAIIFVFINRKFNRLTKELGLKPKMIKQALRGEKVPLK